MRIHELSAPGENLINVDGPLMDSDLLDATLMPALINWQKARKLVLRPWCVVWMKCHLKHNSG